MDLIKSIDLQSLKNAVPEGVSTQIKTLSKPLISFYEQNPKVVHFGVGVAGFYVFNNTVGVHIKHRFFAWLYNQCDTLRTDEYEACKKELFTDLSKIESHDPELKAKKALKILELGVGPGANFQYYPDGSHLIAVDPNPFFQDYFKENLKKHPNISTGEVMICKGEEMTIVPNNSVDAVVVTLVLCSVENVEDVARHVKRILVPGGKFFFMEHISEFDNKFRLRKFLQVFLTKTGLWPLLFDGCKLNRDPVSTIEKVGFSDVTFKRYHAPFETRVFHVIKPHLNGVATK